jgi:signal peptidase II
MNRWGLLVGVAGLTFLIDQLSKQWVVNTLFLGENVIPIQALYPFFSFTRSENTGAAFGILSQASSLFLVVSSAIVIGMIVFYPRTPAHAHLTRIGMALIIGGALGNIFDRLTEGAVIDFIHYYIDGVISNVSNLADHAIVIGVIVILIDSWFVPKPKAQPPTQDDVPTSASQPPI